MDRPVPQQRKPSFNPKAPTFNPAAQIFLPPQVDVPRSQPKSPILPSSPTDAMLSLLVGRNRDLGTWEATEANEVSNDIANSPFRPSESMRPNYCAEVAHSDFAAVDWQNLKTNLDTISTNDNTIESVARGSETSHTDSPGSYAKYLEPAARRRISPDAMTAKSDDSDETVVPSHHKDRAEHDAGRLPYSTPTFHTRTPQIGYPVHPHHFGAQGYARSITAQSRGRHRPTRRLTSARRVPRFHQRGKRSDQGPEASAADIYPEDAYIDVGHHNVESRTFRGSHVRSRPMSTQRQVDLRVEDAADWPTPAEIYMSNGSIRSRQLQAETDLDTSPTQNQRADCKNVEEDVNTDNEMIALIQELLSTTRNSATPSPNMLVKMGENDGLSCDSRPLTPGQREGSRYGLRFYGLGIGDNWNPPKATLADWGTPFRVRPRKHEGWGGWDWAFTSGWVNE